MEQACCLHEVNPFSLFSPYTHPLSLDSFSQELTSGTPLTAPHGDQRSRRPDESRGGRRTGPSSVRRRAGRCERTPHPTHTGAPTCVPTDRCLQSCPVLWGFAVFCSAFPTDFTVLFLEPVSLGWRGHSFRVSYRALATSWVWS